MSSFWPISSLYIDCCCHKKSSYQGYEYKYKYLKSSLTKWHLSKQCSKSPSPPTPPPTGACNLLSPDLTGSTKPGFLPVKQASTPNRKRLSHNSHGTITPWPPLPWKVHSIACRVQCWVTPLLSSPSAICLQVVNWSWSCCLEGHTHAVYSFFFNPVFF